MNTLSVPQGIFTLARYPTQGKDPLRAWDAADEYLLRHLADQQLPSSGSRVLILNDSFGALSVALSQATPWMMSDSHIAHQGTLSNLKDNQIPVGQVSLISSTAPLADDFAARLPGADLILIKITKSLAQLEDQLHRIRPLLKPHTAIIAAGMVKAIHTSTLNLFEKIIGPTRTSLAQKKARLIFCEFDPHLVPPLNSYPKDYQLEGTRYRITNHANVFSREKLDVGTRFFIEHLPASSACRSIIDLGCGNGIVGLVAAERNPQARLCFVDESHMAVKSAEENFQRAFPGREALFRITDCLAGIEKSSADLILNNPPFHQQNTIGDFIALQMFKESHGVLRKGGELWVIGNRHLNYHVKLKRLFGNCQIVASNRKFVILQAIKE